MWIDSFRPLHHHHGIRESWFSINFTSNFVRHKPSLRARVHIPTAIAKECAKPPSQIHSAFRSLTHSNAGSLAVKNKKQRKAMEIGNSTTPPSQRQIAHILFSHKKQRWIKDRVEKKTNEKDTTNSTRSTNSSFTRSSDGPREWKRERERGNTKTRSH